jgi:hypothetical protein
MPETHAAAGEHRHEEAADTCVGVERHGLSPMALTTVPVGQVAPPSADIKDAVGRAGDAMGRAADIIHDVLRACKGWLGVDHPLFGIQLGTQRGAGRRPSSAGRLLRAGQGVGGPEPGQRLTALPAKNAPQGTPGKQEARIRLSPAHPMRRERASRHEAMDMAMRPQGLIPGMEDHSTSDLPTQVALPQLHERLTRRVEQQGQQRSLGREDERIEGVGQGKYQVEIRHRQSRSFAVLHPLDLGERLTRGAVTMATAIIGVPRKSAAGTVFGVPAALRRPAGLDVVHHLLLHGWYGMVTTVRLPVKAEDIGAGPQWSAGRPPGWRTWAGGGMRSHGVTPAWAGVGPRRAGGQRGGGVSPDAVG